MRRTKWKCGDSLKNGDLNGCSKNSAKKLKALKHISHKKFRQYAKNSTDSFDITMRTRNIDRWKFID